MRKTSLNCVYELAKKNKKVIFIGSDLGHGVLKEMKREFPNRYYMEGVSEQNIIGTAAGLAMEGFIPYINTIATFITRRCYEQVVLDLCLHNLPVRLIGNGGGVVYAPLGPTHLATDDIAIFRTLPNMIILSPCDANEMKNLMMQTLEPKSPIYIRVAKGNDKIITSNIKEFKIGKAIILKDIQDTLILSTGVASQIALEAAEKLKKENILCGVAHFNTIKPLDKNFLKNNLPKVKKVVVLEEHNKMGGFGSSILEFCSEFLPDDINKIKLIGFPDKFPDKYGSQSELMSHLGLNVDNVCKIIKK